VCTAGDEGVHNLKHRQDLSQQKLDCFDIHAEVGLAVVEA
jgi:hypothetical protein